MSKKGKEVSDKEVYRLWWEYLKRSQNYKEFCEGISARNLNQTSDLSGLERLNRIFALSKERASDLVREGKENPFYGGYMTWGDVFRSTFDKWWSLRINLPKGAVSDYCERIDSDMLHVQSNLSAKLGREPSLGEFKNNFKEMLGINSFKSYLVVDLSQETNEDELKKQFIKTIRAKKKAYLLAKEDPIFKQRAAYSRLWETPTKPLRFDEVSNYLKIYDHVSALKEQKKSWKNIFADFHPEIEKKLSDETLSITQHDRLLTKKESRQRTLHLEFSNANQIIKNVENGLFPGKY